MKMDHLIINEGQVYIKVPPFEKVTAKATVFYNPVMELNRDLSVAALSVFREDLKEDLIICDAFTGTGIRGLRYVKEVRGVERVIMNDLNPLAVRLARENCENNDLLNLQVCQEDANLLLRKHRCEFNVVDLDPFGTPAPFVESAGIGLRKGGLICVTATDTSALCGTYKNPCIRKYRARPLKTEYCHELGIRILAGFIALTLSKFQKYVDFQFSHSTQHYLRLYAIIGKGANNTDRSLQNIGYIAHCPYCLYRQILLGITPQIPSKCPLCNNKLETAGPLWCGRIGNNRFISRMLDIIPRLNIKKEKEAIKLVKLCKEEADAPPTFYDIHHICRKLKISAPPLVKIMNKLEEEDYFVSRTHFQPTGIKSNAPLHVFENVILSLKN